MLEHVYHRSVLLQLLLEFGIFSYSLMEVPLHLHVQTFNRSESWLTLALLALHNSPHYLFIYSIDVTLLKVSFKQFVHNLNCKQQKCHKPCLSVICSQVINHIACDFKKSQMSQEDILQTCLIKQKSSRRIYVLFLKFLSPTQPTSKLNCLKAF